MEVKAPIYAFSGLVVRILAAPKVFFSSFCSNVLILKIRSTINIFIYLLQHRKAWLLGNCLSTNSTPEIVDFDVSGLFGGIIHESHKPGTDPTKLIGYRIGQKPDYVRRTIKMQCFPLFSILKALGNPTVHYLRY